MPAINHPLPPRPTTSLPPPPSARAGAGAAPGLASPAGLNLPRAPFYSSPQPASPRPSPCSNTYLSYQPTAASSPKLNSSRDLLQEDPVAQVRKALDKDQLRTNADLLQLAQGWKVHWRAWRGPPLLSSASNPVPTSSKPDSTSTKYDPLATFTTNPSSANSRAADAPPAKRPKPTAFDEMMAEVDDEGSVASTSAAPPLKDKLQSLQQLSFAADPVELARKEVWRLGQAAAANGSGGQLLGLFGHVRVAPGKGEHGKGKGKEKERVEEEDPAARMLWVFSLRRGTHMSEGNDGSSRAQLNALEFADLTCVGKGHFSHHDLFPTLYPESTTSGSTSSSSHHAPYVSPSTLSASSFPSALALSTELHSDLAPAAPSTSTSEGASPPQSRLKAPFEAFLAAASEALTVALLTDDATSRPRHSSSTRLDSAVVYLPPPSESFGSTSRRVTSDAVKTTLHLSLQRTGILIQSTIEDLPYRPFPVSSPPSPNSPLLLAPFSTSAQFVKVFPPEAKRGATALAMEEEWKGLLEGTGLRLSEKEAWVLCRIALPSSAVPPTPASDNDALPPPPSPPLEPLEVVWPASLCILDGTKPQPSRSPDHTPPRTKPSELSSAVLPSPSTTLPTTTYFPTTTSSSDHRPLPQLDTTTRRRFASVLRRGLSSTTDPIYRDPISSRAERVGSMLEEQAEERQRREKAAEAALKVAPAPLPPPTPSSLEASKAGVPLPSVPGAGGGGAAAPINMRTPISLGGSSTEAPSPADGFGSAERGLMQVLGGFGVGVGVGAGVGGGGTGEPVGGTKNAEMDHLYPSPSEGMGGIEVAGGGVGVGGGGGGDQPMSAVEPQVDHPFPDFDWGEDFAHGALGGSSNMPGQGQDFDDGMMMGLTDDDFSFFDDPAPLTVSSLPMNNFGGLQSSGPSPKFVDHFSHLTGTTPFASAASPTSPFGHPSPHLHNHASPNLVHFGFDPAQNALGLGSTPAPLHGEGYSPFKTPRTPYSPFVEVTDDHETPAGFPAPTVSIAGTPANSLLLSSRRSGKFDAIHFGNSHALCDDKYDPRKGKFGLPSPDWERDQAAAAGASSSTTTTSASGTDRRPLPLASAPWFTTVCDPRVAAANKLKRKRTPSLAKLAIQPLRTDSSSTDHSSRVRSREWITQDVDSEYGEDESEDEAMEVEEASVLGGAGDEISLSDHYVTGVPAISYTFGAALLLLRQHLGTLLAGKKKAPGAPIAVTKTLQAADTQLEQALSLVADQTMYNPDFRTRSTSASLLKSSTTAIVSPHAIQLVSARLASLTSKFTAAIVPSLKETALPTLFAQRSPSILLRAQQSIMELSTAATSYWRPMGFEPLAGGKDVTAFAIYEEGGAELNGAVAAWLKMVGEAYEGSRLGKHTPGSAPATSTFAGVQDGLGVVPVGALSAPRSRDELNSLASHVVEATRSRKHVVVYLLAPPEAYTSSPASPIVLALQQVLKIKSRASHVSWVTYPLPISSISRWRTIVAGDSSTKRLDHLAFSVYDQLLIPVSSLAFPMPETFPSANLARPQSLGPPTRLFQSPAITLSPSRDAKIEFELNWPPSSLEVMHRHRLLHIAYACSPAHSQERLEWIVVSCVDEKGEIWKKVPKLLRYPPGPVEVLRAKVVWSICKMLIDTADVEWRVTISKLGVPSKAETKAWDTQLKEALAVTKRPLHVTLVGIDTAPPVSVLQQLPNATAASPSASQAHSEEGEVASSITSISSTRKPPHLDTQPSVFAFTPAEPLALGPDSNLMAPASTYLIHVPRIASLAHTSIDPFMASSPLVSVLGLHFLMAHHSKASSLSITLEQHVQDVRQSFVELAALGQTRWGTSGRMAWHLEAARVVTDLVEEVEGERSA